VSEKLEKYLFESYNYCIKFSYNILHIFKTMFNKYAICCLCLLSPRTLKQKELEAMDDVFLLFDNLYCCMSRKTVYGVFSPKA